VQHALIGSTTIQGPQGARPALVWHYPSPRSVSVNEVASGEYATSVHTQPHTSVAPGVHCTPIQHRFLLGRQPGASRSMRLQYCPPDHTVLSGGGAGTVCRSLIASQLVHVPEWESLLVWRSRTAALLPGGQHHVRPASRTGSSRSNSQQQLPTGGCFTFLGASSCCSSHPQAVHTMQGILPLCQVVTKSSETRPPSSNKLQRCCVGGSIGGDAYGDAGSQEENPIAESLPLSCTSTMPTSTPYQLISFSTPVLTSNAVDSVRGLPIR
jgi:hypothetical protein